jgi:hypothetical protein
MLHIRTLLFSATIALVSYLMVSKMLFRQFPITNISALYHQRIVAIGDWHGDYDNVIATLKMAELVDGDHNWAGGDTIFIQTGDIVDRGDDTILLFELIQKLMNQAKRAGGVVVQILGNHEVFNVMGVMTYVTKGDIDSFGGYEQRRKAWSKDGWIGKYVRKLGLTVRVNRTVFFHGGKYKETLIIGASPKWSKYGLETLQKMSSDGINDLSTEELFNFLLFIPEPNLKAEHSPLWYRQYSDDTISPETRCKLLDIALRDLDADRMVVGHNKLLLKQDKSCLDARINSTLLMSELAKFMEVILLHWKL